MKFERRHLGNRAYALTSSALEAIGFLAAFTERTGGKSADPHASLNLSYCVGDDAHAVTANRLRLVAALEIPPFAVAELAHGAKVARIGATRAGAGFERERDSVPGADGLFTSSSRLPMAVTAADCLPIVLASAAEGRVAVVHAGWRGMAAGIVTRAAGIFESPRDVRAAVFPTIGPCHYEVGEDVALAVAAASDVAPVTERRGGRLYLDLVTTARRVLRARGIGRVDDTGLCTACERGRLFSHRRDGTTGRHVAVGMRLE